MPETIQAMRERRDALAKETRNLLDKNTNAEWTEEHQKKYDENCAEIERIDDAVAREQRMLDLEAEQTFEALGGTEVDVDQAANAGRKAFSKLIRNGERALSEDDWTAIRNSTPQNTLSTTTDSEGGFTVQTDVATAIADALKSYGGIRAVANVIRTEGGNPFQYPTSDGTSEEGEIIAENQSATDEDPNFGSKMIGSYKFSSKVIAVPIELLQDSSVDIEAFIVSRIGTRLGRITNRKYTTGTGTNEPEGVVTASTVGAAGAVSAVAAITYEDLLNLEHSVDPAYREQNPIWMMSDAALKLVRGIKDDNGRPLFVPSFDLRLGGAPAELMNYPIQLNQNMAAPAPDARSLLFGSFNPHFLIRDAMTMSLFRFTDSVYTKRGQVGFLAWMRSDCRLVDVGGAIKHFVHGAAA